MSFFNSIFNILRVNKKNWKAIVLCIFAATIFWCFNALNKSYTATISFPLSFDYDHERFVPTRPMPQMVRLNVKGIGWNLLRRSVGVKVPPLVIPLERPTEVKKIVGSTLPPLFANQLSDFQINFVMMDTLRLSLEPKAGRKVHLRLDMPGSLIRDGYSMISQVQIVPDSIALEGPQRIITGLSDAVYIQIPQRNIDDDFAEAVDVKFPNDAWIKRNPSTVEISFQVDKLIKRTDSVKLEVINSPKNALPFIERKKILCTLAVPEAMLNFYNADSIRAILDLENFSKGRAKILPTLEGLPPYTKVIKLDSVFIKF